MIEDFKSIRNKNLKTIMELSTLRNTLIEQQQWHEQQNLKLLRSIIEVLDFLDNLKEPLSSECQEIQQQLLQVLTAQGVQPMAFYTLNIPGLCLVVGTQKAEVKSPTGIVEIVKKGYVKGEKVIRQAHVIVEKE